MTSTNDGKEVKNNLTSGPKGKTYYIELYKSLESSLNESLPLPQRTVALCNAWRQLHSLCSHSAPSTHPHLITWIQRHTATTVLQTEWRTDSSLNERQLLENAIDSFIAEANTSIAGRGDVQVSWEKQLVPRAEWFKKLSSDPWGHAVLLRILDQRGEQPSDDEVLEWLKEERGVVFVSRLRQLVASKCDDIALTLATAVMERVRRTEPPNCDDEDEPKPQEETNKPKTFGDIMRSEAGFSTDVMELLIDIEFVLLDKLEKRKTFIDLAKQIPLKLCYQLAERLRTRLDSSPKEKRLWKNGKHVATTIAQVSVARCMVSARCLGAGRACLYWSARVVARVVSRAALPAAAAVLAAPAASARHLHTFTAALHAECADDMKPFICELYIRAITAGMNELERLKLKTEKENETEARVQEALLASWFVSLGGVLSASPRIRAECDLTAFSLHAAPNNYERLRNSAPPPMLLQEKLEPKVESVSDFGSWANDSRANTNFVKTSETLNLKNNLQQINVVSTAILLEGEALGLSVELCQDLAVLLSGPRVKTFTWEMNREELLANCRAYMERTGGGTKALTTELKYLNLDPSQFQHLPEESDGEDDIYYGIEKGYEQHLAEPEREPQPEQIWAYVSDPERHSSFESDIEEYDYRKKSKKHVLDRNDDQDPLSLHTEVKKKDGHKKERHHSKERSKKPKAKKQTESKEQGVELSTKEQEDKMKKDQIKKERKEKKKQDKLEKALAFSAHSINELVGVKVDQYDKTVLEGNTLKPYKERKKKSDGSEKKDKSSNNCKDGIAFSTADAHGITLMTSPEAGVVFDGLFSMDDLKTISPEKYPSDTIVNLSLNTQTMQTPLPVLKSTSAVTEKQTSMSLADPEKKETKEEIKQRIAKLLSFRKQRKDKISQHCANQKLIQQSHPAAYTATSSSNNLPPMITSTPVATSTEIQIPSQKVDTKPISNQVTISSSKISPVYRSPVNKSVNIIQTQTNLSPLCVQNNNNDNSQMKNFLLETTQDIKPEYAPIARTLPVDNFVNEPRVGSKLISQNHVPNKLQRSHTPKQKTPDQKDSKQIANIGSPKIQPQSTNSSLNKQKVIRMKDFIDEIQQSLITSNKADPNLSNLTSLQKENFKQDALFQSLLNPKVIPAANTTKSLAPQTNKTSAKQIETAPNTFSRLSYMHKNKLDTKQTHNEGKLMSQREAISNELERHIAEFKLAKLQQQNQGSLIVQRGSKKAADNNPVLANMLSSTDNKPNIMSRNKKFTPRQTNPYGSGSNIDKELLNLLHQKAILNQTNLKPHNTQSVRKNELQGTCLDVIKVNKVTDLQRVTKQSSAEGKFQNNNRVLTSLDAHKATATVAKAPQSIKKLAKPKIKQSKSNRVSPLKPQAQKPMIQNVYTNKVDAAMASSFITKDKLKDPSRIQPEQQKPQNWESVMNELLAHRTPSRGPNALNLALNKIKDKKPIHITNEVSTIKSSVIANVAMKQTCNLHISHDKSINIKKETCSSPKEHSEIKILKIQNFPVNQFRKFASKKVKPSNDVKKSEKPVVKPGSKLLLKNTAKPPVNKQIDDEYALLEELIDRDLQQEIDELTSDEDSNMPSSHKVTKTSCKLNDKEIIKTVANQNIAGTGSKANQAIYTNHRLTCPKIEVSKTLQINDLVNENSLQFYAQPNIIVTTPSYIPIQNTVQNVIPPTYTITNQTNSDVVINVPVNLSNMLLVNPNIPCESYAIVQDTYLLHSDPNVYYPNSFSTQVANHTDFQSKVINKLPSEESVEKMNAAESLISMGMTRQDYLENTENVNEVCDEPNNDIPELHVNTAAEVLASEKNVTSTKTSENLASANIKCQLIKTKMSNESNNLPPQNSIEKNKNGGILSQAKEKIKTSSKCEIATEKLDEIYQKGTLKSDLHNLERLSIKRNNLLNRVIHHKGLLEAIPLTYASLQSNSNKENANTNINKARSSVLLPNNEVENRRPVLKKSDELSMENNDTKPCRRILLRSSNSLKQPQPTTTLSKSTSVKTSELTEKQESGKIKTKRQRLPTKSLKKSPQIRKKPKLRKKAPQLKPCKETKPGNSFLELDFEEALSTAIIPKTVNELEDDNLEITDKSLLLAESSESDKLTCDELKTFDSASDILQKEKEIELDIPKETSTDPIQNNETFVLDPHDRLMQQNFTTKGVNLQVIRDIFEMDDDPSPISSQNETTNIVKEKIGKQNQTILNIVDKECSNTHSKIITPALPLGKAIVESNKSLDTGQKSSTFSNVDDEEYLKSVIVTQLYTKQKGERLEKCVRVKLPNNKSFKVTVSGNTDFDIKSLLTNSDVKSIIHSNWHEVKQFKLHVAHNNEKSKVLNAQEIRHCTETIDLLSDDESEKPKENTEFLRTESGTFKMRSIDSASHKIHRDKLLCKAYVNLIRHPKSYFEKLVSQPESHRDSQIEIVTTTSVRAPKEALENVNRETATEHHKCNEIKKVSNHNCGTNNLRVKNNEAGTTIKESTDNLQEAITTHDYIMEKNVPEVVNEELFKSVKGTVSHSLQPCIDLFYNSNKLENVEKICQEYKNQEANTISDVLSVSMIDKSEYTTNINNCKIMPQLCQPNQYKVDCTNLNGSKIDETQASDNISKLKKVGYYTDKNQEVMSNVEVSSVSNKEENQVNIFLNKLDEMANKSHENQEDVDVSNISKSDQNYEKTDVSQLEEVSPKSYVNENQETNSDMGVSCVSNEDETQDTSHINTIEELAANNQKVHLNVSKLNESQENKNIDKCEEVSFKNLENSENISNMDVAIVNVIQRLPFIEPKVAKTITDNIVHSEVEISEVKGSSEKLITNLEIDNETIEANHAVECTNAEEYLENKQEEKDSDYVIASGKESISSNDKVHTKLVGTDAKIISICDGDEHCEKFDSKVIEINTHEKVIETSSSSQASEVNGQELKCNENKLQEIVSDNANPNLVTGKADKKEEIITSVISKNVEINNVAKSIKKIENIIGLVKGNDSMQDCFSKPEVGPVSDRVKSILSPLPFVEVLDVCNDDTVLSINGPCPVENKSKVEAISSPLLTTEVIDLDDSSNGSLDDIIPDISNILESKLHELNSNLSTPPKLAINDLKNMLLDELGVKDKETLLPSEPIVIEDLSSDDDKPVNIQRSKKSTNVRKKSTNARKNTKNLRKRSKNLRDLAKEARTRICFIKLTRCDAKVPETILLDDDDDTDEGIIQVITNEINVNIEESDDELTYVDPEPFQRTESPSILNSYWRNPVTSTELLLLSPEPESYNDRTSPAIKIYDQLASLISKKLPVTILNVPLECSAEWCETKRQILKNSYCIPKESSLTYSVSSLLHLVLELISQTETLMPIKARSKICRIRQLNPMKRKTDVCLFASKKTKRAIDTPQMQLIENHNMEQLDAKTINRRISEEEATLCKREMIGLLVPIEDNNITLNVIAAVETRVNNLNVVKATLGEFPIEKVVDQVQHIKSDTSKQYMKPAVEISKNKETIENHQHFALDAKTTEKIEEKCLTQDQADVSKIGVGNMDVLKAQTKNAFYSQLIENHVSKQCLDNPVEISKNNETQYYPEFLELNGKVAGSTTDTFDLVQKPQNLPMRNDEMANEVISSSNNLDMIRQTVKKPVIALTMTSDANEQSTYEYVSKVKIQPDVNEYDVDYVLPVMPIHCQTEWFETKSILSAKAKNTFKYTCNDHYSMSPQESYNNLTELTEHNYFNVDPNTSQSSHCVLHGADDITSTQSTVLDINTIRSRTDTPDLLIDGTFDIENLPTCSAHYDSQKLLCQLDNSAGVRDVIKEIQQSIRQDVVETMDLTIEEDMIETDVAFVEDNAKTVKPVVEACVFESPNNVCHIYKRDKIIANDDATKSIQIEVSIDYDAEEDKTPLVSPCEALNTSNDVDDEIKCSTPLSEDGITIKGIEIEDPLIGRCFIFRPIGDSSSETDSIRNNDSPGIDSESLNVSTDSMYEIVNEYEEDSQNSTADSIKSPKSNEKEIIPYEKSPKMDNLVEELHDVNYKVIPPKETYFKNTFKRKLGMGDIKIPNKKYRKGKNIDTPKQVSFSDLNYGKEYKKVMDYVDTLSFSYSIPFHKDHLDVETTYQNWPIKGLKPPPFVSDNTCIGENMLFVDTQEIKPNIFDPKDQSLDEEISQNIDYEIENSVDIQETNFKTGFGERSGRVIQNYTKGGDHSKFSAATLSDVKQNQPILMSGDCKDKCLTKNASSVEAYNSKINQHLNYLNLRKKVKMFFEKSKRELYNEGTYKMADKHLKNPLRNVPGLYDTDFFVPALRVEQVQVVQVGQPPVSAAAQNPVTCDPRVTQVSNASPSQCCGDNSPGSENNEPNFKAEYTQLTNADLSMVPGLAKRFPLMTQTAQEDVNVNAEESSVSPNFSNIGSPNNESQPNMDNSLLDNSNDQINMVFQLERNDSELGVVSQDNVSSSSFMTTSTTTTTTTQIVQQIEPTSSNGSSEKTDQIAHAMNAAGITITTDADSHPLVNVITQKVVRPGNNVTTNNYQKTQLNTISLQQALAQILPPQLNQSITNNGNQQNVHNNVGPQVLHIVQGKNANGNHITLLDNNPQTVLNASNATQVLHIVQNKPANSGTISNGTPTIQPSSFGGLSLVDTGLQQGGNQLLHIVNTGQKSPTTGQLLKRVNLLTNLTNVQGANDQKMVQFVCKSADGKAIHLNAPNQRGMVLRLQPIENTSSVVQAQVSKVPQDESSVLNQDNGSQEMKPRTIYEDNYSKYVQDSNPTSSPIPEKATSLPKFNQAFGKPLYQEGTSKENEINNSPIMQMTSPETDRKCADNNITLDGVGQLGSPPLLLRKANVPSSTAPTQQNIVHQLKQTIGPMNIQTMHGGVIYTRQIPVNLSGGQTINLITVPTTDLIDESGQKQQSEIEPSIIKIVSQSQSQTTSITEGNEESNTTTTTGTDSKGQTSQQTQPVLTHMRIKLPMLSKAPQVVSGTRVVRPSFFQIQRNIVGGANQQVFQQYVFTTAPQLGQQTIRLPQAQVTRQVKVPTENQSSSESQLSSSTLEQLREFDMVLEQVKERSTVQPGTPNSFTKQQSDVTDSPTIKVGESNKSIIYSIGNNQTVNVAYVTRRPSILTPTTCTFVRSPDTTALNTSSTTQVIHSTNDAKSSDHNQIKSKIASKSIKSKPSKPPITSTASTIKVNPIPPKPSSTQKPLEDEQTTQRILYILAEYKEQVENSPDKDKPAPRRRSNPPTNPPGLSKRKKGSGGSRRPGCTRDHSPVTGEDSCRTMGSEDSSCGTSQGDCTENCSMETSSPQDSPRKVVRKLSFDPEATVVTQSRPAPPRNVIVADGQTITVARSGTPGKPATAVLMPANYILPVSMVKGGQQIAIVTNRGPKLLTVGGATGDGATTNALLLQRLIGGSAGLKPVLARPGVRHVRLPTTALQAFNLMPSVSSPATTTTISSPASVPTPELVQSQASSPWPERDSAKSDRTNVSENEQWNLQSASETQDYSYGSENNTPRTNDNRTVLEAIPDRYSPDMEAQRIFDKMFDVDTKKSLADSQDESSRVSHGFDINADCDDRAYTQVVQRKDGSSHGLHRVTQISAAALRHKYAMLEHELKLQKSLSEECEDLGVDSPSASELFPEAELLFSTSPAGHDDHATTSHAVPGQGVLNQPAAPSRELEDQIAAEHLLAVRERAQQDLTEVRLSTGGKSSRPGRIDHEEFARSHPNTTFHTEPTDDVTPAQPYTLATGLKSRHLTSTIFHAGPTTVLMSAPQSVIAQTHQDSNSLPTVKYSDIDNIIHLPSGHNTEGTLVKDDGLTRYDILSDRELHLSNTASAIVHASGAQVIKRVCYDDDKRSFLMDETDIIAGNDAKMAVANEDSRDAALEAIGPDDDRSSPERPELFWESNSASEEKHLDFSSDSEKCCKSPSLDETNSTDSSGIGSHMRLDSVIKEARSRDRSGSVEGSSADDSVHPPLRTYPAKRSFHSEEERSLSGKTRAGENPDSPEVRRRSSVRGVVKRGCHCCNGSPTPSRKKPRQRKPNMDFNSN